MGVLNLTITQSAEEALPGIPRFITITSNEPCVIFYTLDGTKPTTFSPVYISPIELPSYLLNVVLNVFATNQINSSPVIVQQWSANVSQIPAQTGARLPHATVSGDATAANNSLFPFGTNTIAPNGAYNNPSNAGYTVYNQSLPATPNGFDANGNPAAFTNQPIDNFKFALLYSTTNANGETPPGVGNMPSNTTIIGKETSEQYTKISSSFSDKIFDPRALVIYQDSTTEDPTNPVHLNRQHFSTEDQEIVRDGNLLFNSSLDAPTTMGSFINTHYNPRTNMMTSYYYDNTTSRWIISSYPYQPTTKDPGALYQMVFARSTPNNGGARVYKWIPFFRRGLT